MNIVSRILIAALALAGCAHADQPKKAPIMKYSSLWTNSPFTSRPPPPEAGPAINPLEDYALAGVSPISGGYRVTLLNKKNPGERITVNSDEEKSKHGFRIIEVIRKPGNPLGTVVHLSSGAVSGNVAFDEKLLTLAAAPVAAKANPQNPAAAPATPQPKPGAPSAAPVRQPRPRVVPPPAPQPNPGAAPARPAQNIRPDVRGTRR